MTDNSFGFIDMVFEVVIKQIPHYEAKLKTYILPVNSS